MMDRERAAALVVMAILETIQATGEEGAPLGIMYAALMGQISYDTFTLVIDALTRANAITVRHHCAFMVNV